MIPTAWTIARSDLTRWRRSPALVAATLIPAAGMSLTVLALTFAVGRQPVALVREGYGPVSERVVEILRQSDGFFLRERTPAQAAADLENQWVCAVISIPKSFGTPAAALLFFDNAESAVPLPVMFSTTRMVTRSLMLRARRSSARPLIHAHA